MFLANQRLVPYVRIWLNIASDTLGAGHYLCLNLIDITSEIRNREPFMDKRDTCTYI